MQARWLAGWLLMLMTAERFAPASLSAIDQFRFQ